MLTIGQKFPQVTVTAVTSNEVTGFKEVTTAPQSGRWQVYFFWPKDFTFVCPTEIQGFADLHDEFQAENTDLYGVSTDSEFVHMAWRQSHPALENLPFAMLSDLKRELATALGILHEDGVCLRATYVVDPEGIIRHVSVNDLNVGRSPEETLRLTKGFQNGGLMPCNWQPGQEPLQVS